MDLTTFLVQSPDLPDRPDTAKFASNWATTIVQKGTRIIRQGDPETNEFIVLSGHLASRISDPDGNEICVGLYVGPTVVTPNIARTRGGASLVELVAMTDARVAQLDTDRLTELMILSEPIRDWANGVLRRELGRKADREWCLAALGGADRLAWFREQFPDYESVFPHALIASFLGITPVTLSRLRHKDTQS